MISSVVLFIINPHTKYIGFYSGNRICNLHITIQISLWYVFGLEWSVGDTVHMMTIIIDIGLLYKVEQLYLCIYLYQFVIHIYDYIYIYISVTYMI